MYWPSGGPFPVLLEAPVGVGVRWMQFGLAVAYDLGQWQRAESEPSVRKGRARRSVFSGAAAELPFPAPVDEPPWSEAVLRELGSIPAGVVVEWSLQPDPEIPRATTSSANLPEVPGVRVAPLSAPERALKDQEAARRTGLRWRVNGRILARGDGETEESVVRVSRLIEAASHLEGGNRLVYRAPLFALSTMRSQAVLTEAELVGLFPPPFSSAFPLARDESLGRACLWIGRDLQGSPVGIPIPPTQGRHLLVLGETGMGKSSLVVRLAWQAARWGSVILFDPVGDTGREFLAGLPDRSVPNVAWVAPSHPGLSLSVLDQGASNSGHGTAQRERLLGDVVAALRRVRAGRYAESTFWGPRLEEMLLQAIRAASHWPGGSLAIAERLLSPGAFPFGTVPDAARESVGDVRRRIDAAPQDGDGARRLLSEITRNEVLSEMLDADTPTWSIASAVTPGRITVISGDAPVAGESTARYLLAVMLALAWNAVLGRRESSKTFLVLDEAQWYVHDGVGEMLRLGRRFNLHVWAATQSLGSLPESVRDSFRTNSADLVLFRGDPGDVRDVSRWVPQLAPERVMRMRRGEAAVLIGKGSETHWVRLPTPVAASGDPARFVSSLLLRPAESGGATGGPERATGLGGITEEPAPAPTTSPLPDVLRELLTHATGGSELTIRLSELRVRWQADPAAADKWVRAGGRTLSAAGVLLRTGRDGAGSFWVLSRDRLAQALTHWEESPGLGVES